jgi:hypothetical protein
MYAFSRGVAFAASLLAVVASFKPRAITVASGSFHS